MRIITSISKSAFESRTDQDDIRSCLYPKAHCHDRRLRPSQPQYHCLVRRATLYTSPGVASSLCQTPVGLSVPAPQRSTRQPGSDLPASRCGDQERSIASRSSSVGSAIASGTPKAARLGPIPRTTILSLPLWLPRMKPAITMSSPVLTNARVLMSPSFESSA